MKKIKNPNRLILKSNIFQHNLKIYIILVASLFPLHTMAQEPSIDSIKILLKSNLSDNTKKASFYSYLRKRFTKDSLATITFAIEAKNVAKDINSKIFLPIAELSLGDAYMTVQDYANAFSSYKSCYLLSNDYNDTVVALNAAQNLSYFYRQYGDPGLAIEYALKALRLSEMRKSERGCSINSMNVGHSLKEMKRFNDALVYYRNAYHYAVLDSNSTMIPNSLMSIGNAFKEKGTQDSALFYYIKAREFCEKNTIESKAYATVLSNLGDYYLENQIIDSAYSNYIFSLKIARTTSVPATVVHSLINIAKIFAIEKHFTMSQDSLYSALKIAEKVGLSEPKIEIYKLLAENYYNQQDFVQSHRYVQLAQNYIDSFYKTESLRITNNLQIIYEVEKKENDILNLNVLNTQQKQKNLILKVQKDSISYRLLLKSNEEKLNKANNRILNQEKNRLILEKKADKNSLYTLEIKIESAKLKATSDSLAAKQLILELEKNKAIKSRTIAYSIAGILTAFVIFIIVLYNNKIRLKNAQIKLTNSELKVGRLQIKPHTIMNFIRAIEDDVSKNNYTDAKPYLSRLKNLMSGILAYSELNQISLSKEIQLLKDYLELEKLRKNNFDYKLNIGFNIETDSIFVLPIILLPFIENSIWHGFSFPSAENKGLITISIDEENNQLIFSIEDNGIGQKSASMNQMSRNRKSMGMAITKERIEKYNFKNGMQTIFEVKDLNTGFKVKFNLYKEHAF